jgi:ABC-type Mn2+/Zn2+ transport system ATPase subunit
VIEPLVEVTGAAAGYGGPPVLEDITFAVAAGERVGVLGPNGGGKSTLFRMLLGELAPLRGAAIVRARIGTVPQTERSRLDYPVSALDVALMGSIARLRWWRRPGRSERKRAHEALEVVGLAEVAGSSFGELSGGQRQRVLIARTLVQDAELLLLDEPFAGVDEPSTGRLLSLIDRLAADGRGVMVATHDVDQAGAWDRVLCLNRRQVAFGPPATTLTAAVLEATHRGAIVTLPAEEPVTGGARRAVMPPAHHEHRE